MSWTLFSIVGASLLSGALSVACALILSTAFLCRILDPLVGLSTGLLLSTALLQLMPEAFEAGISVHYFGLVLLITFMLFFVLEKMSLLRHNHHHEADGHDHEKGHDRNSVGPGGLLILMGNLVHNFTDGLAVAVAFASSSALGWLTALAIAAHAIPQEIGDFIILLGAGYSRRRALIYNLITASFAVLGGVLGYYFLKSSTNVMPYLLVFSAASFMYISLADLVPALHEATRKRGEYWLQLLLIGLGIFIVFVIGQFLEYVGMDLKHN